MDCMDNDNVSADAVLSLHLPAELKSRLRDAGEKTGHKMSGLVRLAVEQYLDQHVNVDAPPGHEPAWKRVLDALWPQAQLRNDEMIVRLSIAEIKALVNMTHVTVLKAFETLEERGDIWRAPRRGWGGRRTVVLRSVAFVPKVDADAVFGAPIEYLRPVQDVALSARPGAVSG